MCLFPSWRASASSRRLLAVLVTASLWTAVGAGQEAWKIDYDAGVRAYEKGDLATAEQKLLKSLGEAPKNQVKNETVLLESQLRGFIPDYYLAMIYAKREQWADVLKYGANAETYLKAGDKLTELKKSESLATNATKPVAVVSTPPPAPAPAPAPDTGRATPPVSPPSPSPTPVDVVTPIRTALGAGRLAEAQQLRDRARATGASGSAFDQVSREVDQATDVRDARQALAAGQFAGARAAVSRARPLGVDPAALDTVDAEITKAEASALLVTAQKALGDRRYAEATSTAQRVKALGGDPVVTDDIVRKATAGLSFETLMSQANAALARNAFPDARDAARRAKDLGVDPTRADALGTKIDAAERTLTTKLSTVEQERVGMRNFFSGDYAAAINVLTPIVTTGGPRAQFYLASSEAALSMLESDATKRAALEADARRDWAPIANAQATLAPDLAYLSPGIAKLLGISAR